MCNVWILFVRHEEEICRIGRLDGGQLARNVNLGRLKTGERIFDSHRHRSGWIAESAELFAFGKNLTSREDVYTE